MDADVARTLFHASTIQARLDEMAQDLTVDYENTELTVIAILNGSMMFVADLLRRLPLRLQVACLSVASYHGATESTGVVEFLQIALPDVKGRRVLLMDDILDSGRTLAAIREKILRECDPAEVRVCVLLSKRKTRAEEVKADYVGFEIENEFVVGYGLDYREKYRNLPYIGVLKPELISG